MRVKFFQSFTNWNELENCWYCKILVFYNVKFEGLNAATSAATMGRHSRIFYVNMLVNSWDHLCSKTNDFPAYSHNFHTIFTGRVLSQQQRTRKRMEKLSGAWKRWLIFFVIVALALPICLLKRINITTINHREKTILPCPAIDRNGS